jgi:predicted RNA methylase
MKTVNHKQSSFKFINRYNESMDAIAIRDDAWENSTRIPTWVRGRDIGLDQYNTLPEVAAYCWESFQATLKKDGATLKNFKIIEPSAGTGAFYDLLPKDKRIGIDVDTFRDEYVQQDFLTWEPNFIDDRPCVAIGNPPFGYRGWLALEFMNKAAEFCEYVGFILPMSFQSDGKGSPKNRVKGMMLVHSEHLSGEVFVRPDGQKVKVNTLWQIWKKGEAAPLPDLSLADDYIDIFTVDMRKERLCGMDKIDKSNTFLQRSYFKEPPTIVDSFSKVKYVCGYGIIIKKNESEVRQILNSIDWNQYSNLATHSVKHISMYHIKKALLDNLPKYAKP